MCGICGIVSVEKVGRGNQETIHQMSQSLIHRGPDDDGYYCDDHALLGIRRLAIIDLITGNQPITNENRSLWLVFNGEIYNYKELRHQLEDKGHRFSTQGDSEVILHAYEEYRERCVDHLNGMFAFAIWDSAKKVLFLARDRIGIKPLYYWSDGKQIAFGSELKALLHYQDVPTQIDPSAIDLFLTLEYIPGPWTIYKDVYKLLPGHYLLFENGSIKIEKYWNIQLKPEHASLEECIDELTGLIRDSVKKHMISDVPLGVFLSGGIDSSTVVGLMRQTSGDQINTFSIGFEDSSYNELPYARAVASHFHTEHNEEVISPNISDLFDLLVGSMDEPFGDFSIFPTYLVSKFASQSVKVVLTGDGGDEVFGGYDTYLAQKLYRWIDRLPSYLRINVLPALSEMVPPQPEKKGVINKAKRLIEGGQYPPSLQHARWMIFLDKATKGRLYSPEFSSSLNGYQAIDTVNSLFNEVANREPLAQQQYVDIKTYLVDDILTKVDRMSMAASLEARVPLLDHRIVEYCLNLPTTMKIRGGQTKYILRRAMQPLLPKMVIDKPKEGFSIPIKHWLCSSLRSLMYELLSPQRIKSHGYFNHEVISKWVEEHLDGKINHSHRLWAHMVFERWLENKVAIDA